MKRTSILAASLMCSVMLSAQTREGAVLFSGGAGMDDSFLLTENMSVVFGSDGNATIYKGETSTGLTFDGTTTVTAEFKDAFSLKANQDPKNEKNYYSTFFTQKGAYKVPEGTLAYAGALETGGTTDVLRLTDVGSIIHTDEPVILRATGSSITLMPSANDKSATTPNALLGTEEGISSAKSNVYALSLGQSGVGFYLWSGKEIGANKAYLSLEDNEEGNAKAFTFRFDDEETTGIQEASPKSSPEGKDLMYNLNGVRVNDNYKGIVIKNGKKLYQR